MTGMKAGAEVPREICIVMLSAIGDAVHVLPVANALKRARPDCRITWVIQPVPRIFAGDHPAIDEYVVWRRRRGMDAWRAFADYADEMKGRRFDLMLGLQVYFKAGLLQALTPAERKLGFDRERARDLNWLFTNERIEPHPVGQHVQDQYFEFVRHLGVDPEPVVWDIPFSGEERTAQARFFEELGQPGCAIVVGTSKTEKNWDSAGWAEVVDALHADFGLQPVLVGGPSEVERRIADEILEGASVPVVDTLGDDLRRLMWIVDGSALTVSGDTGPLHISVALNTPVVGLYGYTNPKRTGPYRRFGELVVDGYAKYPGEDYPLSMEYRDGMKRITPEMVLEKVQLWRERYGPEGGP